MSKQQPQTNQGRREIGRLSAGRGVLIAGVILGVIALAWWSLAPRENRTSNPGQPETNASPVAVEPKPAFQKIVGKWVRPDGGYVVDIRSVDDTGKVDAGYFNPSSIFVSRAEATAQGSMIKVFIELRDVNYPGSTYTLAYDPAGDLLKGVYYQAAMQQHYEVFFERSK